jgi:hypothetical protein
MASKLIDSNDQDEGFNYQMDCLKIEIDLINQIIDRMDTMAQTTKKWAIVTWAGSIALAINQNLESYILLTAILPILFSFIDGTVRRLQARSIFRMNEIYSFLNDERLRKSFEKKQLISFSVLDPVGRQYINNEFFKTYTSLWRTMFYFEIKYFYGGLILISLVLGAFFLFARR